jgi:hypothetical protein
VNQKAKFETPILNQTFWIPGNILTFASAVLVQNSDLQVIIAI